MIVYLLELLLAVVLAQAFVTSLIVWFTQRKNPLINYNQSLVIYIKKGTGRYIAILFFTLIVMFILSDWMDLSVSRAELREKGQLSRAEYVQMRFKTFASLFGMVAEVLAAVVYRGAIKAILDFGKSKGIDTDDLSANG